MKIDIKKKFSGEYGIPLTLWSINNENIVSFAKDFGQSGFQKNEYFIMYEESYYKGINIVWQCEVNAKDIRELFKRQWNWGDFRGNIPWEQVSPMLYEMIRYDINTLCNSGITLNLPDRKFRIDGSNFSKLAHFVGCQWLKDAYIKCCREDNNDHKEEGCFITTAVCTHFGKIDDCYELTMFRHFRDHWLIHQSDGKSLIDEYYEIAPKIVDKINQLINANEVYQSIWQNHLKPCLKFIELGNNEKCKQLYCDMVNSLKAQFLS
ncbi:MAG: hypothetical protein IJ862_05035 [Selenomonadaceae bacterium]|nr:hypothetical protein [Selenomonadaceae bacterium]